MGYWPTALLLKKTQPAFLAIAGLLILEVPGGTFAK